MKPTQENFKLLEQQLSCPEGTEGIEVAKTMNLTNISMTRASMDALRLPKGSNILEIGHGNCGHLSQYFQLFDQPKFYGLEVSKTMYQEALKYRDQLELLPTQAAFYVYDGTQLPFENHSMDAILSVNTLYFWQNPQEFLKEISRVLTTQGSCIISFALRAFMEDLPFVRDKFTLYSLEEFKQLLVNSPLQLASSTTITEQVKSKSGDLVHREFAVATLTQCI
ncbi:conserved hypothetical protein [Tenacibaculum litopenaei]|uniref:class I SAM-dependent methyltransferase n=1 Tax=Tenacibaculum litopenaei TaxID=396016 RepID=UPI0038967083